MQMKISIKWVAATIVLAVLFHLMTVMFYPSFIMSVVMHKMETMYAGVNRIMHAPPTTAESRRVVRPSPDLLYSACVYDVSKGPIKITARVPDTYWSISFYETNTDNFFVKNDRQIQSKEAVFILKGKGKPGPDAGDIHVIEAPTDRGVFLIRMLIEDENELDSLIEIQKQATCIPLG